MRFSSPLLILGAGLLAVACSSSTDADAPTATTTTLDGGTGCKSGAECATGICNADNGQCLPATAGDGKKNGTETDVDCGGPSAPKCAVTKACTANDDCTSDVCAGNVCIAAPTSSDGIQNGTETDVDCGGPAANPCDTGLKCTGADDCASKHCDTGSTNRCLAPTFMDKIQNGTETDVDCGGTVGHECAAALKCKTGTDCQSAGCAYNDICTPKASCTPQHGGDTCLKDDGSTESCCTQVSVDANKFTGAAFTVDKYVTTAGRMRAFLTAVNGDVRGYITQHAPSWWQSDWTPWLPSTFNGHVDNDYDKPLISTTVKGWNKGEYTTNTANPPAVTATTGAAHDITVTHQNLSSTWAQVNGGILYDQGQQGCYIGTGSYGHPTYLVAKDDANKIWGDGYTRWMKQEALDERPINCTNLLVLAALCAFDGGMPMNEKQYAFIYDDDGSLNQNGTALSPGRSTYPWGSPPPVTEVASPSKCVAGAAGCCDHTMMSCNQPTGYDASKPHPGGYYDFGAKNGGWTMVGPGNIGFNSYKCPWCDDSWVNWQYNYQDVKNLPATDDQGRDNSYVISVPGSFPKGQSRAFNGQHVQDIAGLMFESVLASSGSYTNAAATYLSFGTDETTDDVVVNVPTMSLYGGSFEGHAVGAGATYRLPTKYGKMTTRCAYPVK